MNYFLICVFGFFLFPLSSLAQENELEIRVAKDGSGHFLTIQEAVMSVRDFSPIRVVISIKNGIYREKLVIPSQKTNITLKGESPQETRIVFDDHVGKGDILTYNSYTLLVEGNGFEAENLSIENVSGPVGQAVALHVKADKVWIRHCSIRGYQDTLFPAEASSRQYYTDCYIEGTTDFIFGAATAVFERCHIHSKKNSFITAASTSKAQTYGFVFLNCLLTADAHLNKVFLGRPWRPFAKTVFIHTHMGVHIVPAGWSPWNDNNNHLDTFYAEYGSKGPGANSEKRVAWSKQLTPAQVRKYTINRIFQHPRNPWFPQKEAK